MKLDMNIVPLEVASPLYFLIPCYN